MTSLARAIGVVLLVAIVACAPRPPKKTLLVTVAWLGTAALAVTNHGSADVVDTTVAAYVNGTPPDGYTTLFTMPAIGKGVLIPLNTFADGERRFDPTTQVATVVWVGGGAKGYDFMRFEK